MKQFNLVDTSMLLMETSSNPFHVAVVNIYDPSTCPREPPGFDDIAEAIRLCLPAVPVFRRKIIRVPLDVDFPYWIEDEDFDFDFHVRQLALPKPGNWTQFTTQVSRLLSRPLDLSRSPWEVTIIEEINAVENLPEGCFAMVIKVHHSAIDGVTGVQLLNALHTLSPGKRPQQIEDNWQPEQLPATKSLVYKALINGVSKPVSAARLLLRNFSTISRKDASVEDISDDDTKTLPTIFNAPLSPHRAYEYTIHPLEDMKRMRRSVEGATINDVCLTIVGGAMYRYLEAKSEAPEVPLTTHIPISTRELTKEGETAVNDDGNHFTHMHVSLHTDIRDPLQRLKAIAEETRHKKATQRGAKIAVMQDIADQMPGALMGLALRFVTVIDTVAPSHSPTFCNTTITNVPGSSAPLYLLGAKAVEMTGAPPLVSGIGISHSLGSYNGDFSFTIIACRDILPDARFYCECIDASFQELLDESNKQGRSNK